MLMLREVGTVLRRQGYEADLKAIAKASPEDCVDALCGGGRAMGRVERNAPALQSLIANVALISLPMRLMCQRIFAQRSNRYSSHE